MGIGASRLDAPPGIAIEEVAPANAKTLSGPVYRRHGVKELIERFDDEVGDVWELMSKAAKIHATRKWMGTRTVLEDGSPGPYKFHTYAHWFEKIKVVAAGIEALGLLTTDYTGKMQVIGLAGVNRPEWVMTEMGTFALGGTTVPFYTSYGVDEYTYAINLISLATIACMAPIAEVLLKCKPECPTLKTLVCFDPVDEATKERFRAGGVELLGFDELVSAGEEHPLESFPGCDPDQVYSFVWTSGSTGTPKAVMLKHRTFIANLAGAIANSERSELTSVNSSDIYLSYLPIGHVMERTSLAQLLWVGARAGFFRGTREAIMEDLAELRPTVFLSVPRLLNKIYDKVMSGVRESGKEAIVQRALSAKIANLHSDRRLTHPLWDNLIFNKLARKLGLDRVRLIGTGSAPIYGPVLDWYRVVFKCPVSEGYGQSEVTCASTGTHPGDLTWGHVGTPLPWAEVKLVSVPDMGYNYDDTQHGTGDEAEPCNGRGEICVRGPCTFTAYYRNEEATRKTIDDEGFVHSGDIGMWMPDGNLKIVDRKKNIFKLSQGEYVAPEKIEGALMRSPIIAQTFVHGDSLQSCLVAVVCPDPDFIVPWAIKAGIVPPGSSLTDPEVMATICASPEANAKVIESIKEEGRKGKLFSFEVPKAVYLEPVAFDPSNGLLTSTFKLRRQVAQGHYKQVVADLYAQLASAPPQEKRQAASPAPKAARKSSSRLSSLRKSLSRRGNAPQDLSAASK